MTAKSRISQFLVQLLLPATVAVHRTMTKTAKLKAYEVREPDEGACVVVYAHNNVTARRLGASELNLSFEEVESCTRQPQFDQFAPGPVPLSATLASGWWHTCTSCGCQFEKDGMVGMYDNSDVEAEEPFEPVEDEKQRPYCSLPCMMQDWQHRRECARRETALIEACLSSWPSATNIHPHVYLPRHRPVEEQSVSFSLPGLLFPVRWTLGASTLSVDQRDVHTYQAHYSLTRPKPSEQREVEPA